MRSHLGLEETLRTGRPADDVSGGDPATVERFMRAMRNVAAPRAPHERRGPRALRRRARGCSTWAGRRAPTPAPSRPRDGT